MLVIKTLLLLPLFLLLIAIAIPIVQFHSDYLPTTAFSLFTLQRHYLSQPLPLPTPTVAGYIDPNYVWIKKEFQRSFDEGREVGAQVAAYKNGKLIASLYGGSIDLFTTDNDGNDGKNGKNGKNTCAAGDDQTCGTNYMSPMTADVVLPVFSSGKVAESFVMALLAASNHLSFASPIAKYWPAFSANGKENITVAELMRHQAGLANPDVAITRTQIGSKQIGKVLAKNHQNYQTPVDGESTLPQLYHAITRGMYANEVCKRVDPDHRSIGEYFRREVVEKYDVGRFYLGINDEEWNGEGRVGKTADVAYLFFLRYIPQYFLPFSKAARRWVVGGDAHDTLQDFEAAILFNMVKKAVTMNVEVLLAAVGSVKGVVEGMERIEDVNDKEFLKLQLSSANGLANAESMAKLGDVIMAWGKQEKRAGLEKGSKRFDYGVNFPVAYTAAGWGVDRLSLAGLDGWKGWAGASGSMLQWHDELNITFAYTTVLPYGRVGKPRAERLMKELVRQAGGWVR